MSRSTISTFQLFAMARDSAGCECKGWCGCHKPGWPAGETCDCKPELDFEDVA